jgi:MarR family transcriptional regulator for hemolysin
MPRPPRPPIGLQLTRTSRVVSRAFDEALSTAGGSLPRWLVLVSLKTRALGNQRELAEAVGIQEATLSHHLNAMAEQGLLTRERDPANRRVHQVRLTEVGEAAFLELRGAAIEFDRRLRAGLSDDETAVLERLLARLASNVSTPEGRDRERTA